MNTHLEDSRGVEMSQRIDLMEIKFHVSYNYTRNIRSLAPNFSPSDAPFTGISIKPRHLSPKNDQLALDFLTRPEVDR